MKKRGKRHSALLEKAVGDERQTVADAVDLLQQMKSAKLRVRSSDPLLA